MKHSPKDRGFTLAELLIVIAIISILAAIVFVSLNEPREKARIAGGQQFEQQIMSAVGDSAVGIWEFEEGSGAVAGDRSGFENDGSISGATWVDNEVLGGKALKFNGGHVVNVPHSPSLDISGPVTISMWVKTEQFEANWRNALEKGGGCGSGDRSYMIATHSAVWGLSVGICSVLPGPTQQEFRIDDNIWHHLAWSADGEKWRAYIDGEKIDEVSRTQLPASTTNELHLGGTSLVGVEMDKIRIFEKALSAEAIQKIYAQQKHKYVAER